MSNVTYDYMDTFIKSLVPEKEGFLAELEKSAREAGVPIVQKEVANFLELMIKIIKPKRILELGTAVGYSALVMANAYEGIERIDTIERNPDMIQQAEQNIASQKKSDIINIHAGDCMEIIKSFDEKYDIIFMDAGKGHYNHFLPECLRLLKDDGVIIADNALYKGMVASKELVVRRKITIVKRMKKYLELINEDKNLITSVIPMGDGIAVTRRR